MSVVKVCRGLSPINLRRLENPEMMDVEGMNEGSAEWLNRVIRTCNANLRAEWDRVNKLGDLPNLQHCFTPSYGKEPGAMQSYILRAFEGIGWKYIGGGTDCRISLCEEIPPDAKTD